MNNTEKYPNKIYVCEHKGENTFTGGHYHYVVIVAAINRNTARQYVKEKIGFECEPVWLMDAVYPTIWTSDGSISASLQVKILSNNNYVN